MVTVEPGIVIGRAILVNGQGLPAADAEIDFRLDQPPVGGGVSCRRTAWTATADDEGAIAEEFVAESWYVAHYGRNGPEYRFRTPASGEFEIPLTLSRLT